ncbi:hypothetical protein F2Q69_00029160 [Brassica cretica]|uniref:Uncharacterized protein n=1 Tax=Brassica cretica TaxID=69181 RepID=A0A8S9RQG1_BRACR|nr:hypothetical protein F2Q69_00029160 [Brassica cretica]
MISKDKRFLNHASMFMFDIFSTPAEFTSRGRTLETERIETSDESLKQVVTQRPNVRPARSLRSDRARAKARSLRSDRAIVPFCRYVPTELKSKLGRYVATEPEPKLGRYVATERSSRLVATAKLGC